MHDIIEENKLLSQSIEELTAPDGVLRPAVSISRKTKMKKADIIKEYNKLVHRHHKLRELAVRGEGAYGSVVAMLKDAIERNKALYKYSRRLYAELQELNNNQ